MESENIKSQWRDDMYKRNQIEFPSYLDINTRFFVIAGFTLNGPVGTPFSIKSDIDPESVIGNSKMLEDYYKVKESGVNPLILRMNGSHGEATLTHEELGIEALNLKTIEAKDQCNEILIHLLPQHMVIKGLSVESNYFYADYADMHELAAAINIDFHYSGGEVEAKVINNVALDGFCLEENFVAIEGADDGFNYVNGLGSNLEEDVEEENFEEEDFEQRHLSELLDNNGMYERNQFKTTVLNDLDVYQVEENAIPETPEDMEHDGGDDSDGFEEIIYEEVDTEDGQRSRVDVQLELLAETFLEKEGERYYMTSVLTGLKIDTILFTDIPYEFAHKEISQILGLYALQKTSEQKLFCSVVLGTDKFKEKRFDGGIKDVYPKQIDELIDVSPATLRQADYLKHLEVVVGQEANAFDSNGTITCAPSYAAMRYNLPINESASNKVIKSIETLYSDELYKNEVANLSSNGYICIVTSIRKGFVPYSSKNCFVENTLHSKPHFLRSIYNDLRKVSMVFDSYIGSFLSVTVIQTILSEIDGLVELFVKDNSFYQYVSVEVVDFGPEFIKIAMVFDFYGEVERVRTTFSYEPASEAVIEWEE